ncbi:MAG: CPBP family intramembrane glutamic endopeptidase [Sedimentisphaerales bacterium]
MPEVMQSLKKHPVISFYLIAFAISWLGWAPQVAASHGLSAFQNPFFQFLLILPAFGPALAAIIVVNILSGKTGSKDLLASLLRWRVGVIWYMLALFGPVALLLGAVVLDILFSDKTPNFGRFGTETWSTGLVALAIALLSNPWEEVGWRGFALAKLQLRYSACVSTLIVGILWSLWHLPLFWTKGHPMSTLPFLPWLVGVIAAAFIYTWLYNSSKGSLLIVSLFHISFNTVGSTLATIHTGSHLSLVAVSGLVAVFLLVTCGPAHLSCRADS